MKLIGQSLLIYLFFFFGGGGTLLIPYFTLITILYLTGVIG